MFAQCKLFVVRVMRCSNCPPVRCLNFELFVIFGKNGVRCSVDPVRHNVTLSYLWARNGSPIYIWISARLRLNHDGAYCENEQEPNISEIRCNDKWKFDFIQNKWTNEKKGKWNKQKMPASCKKFVHILALILATVMLVTS